VLPRTFDQAVDFILAEKPETCGKNAGDPYNKFANCPAAGSRYAAGTKGAVLENPEGRAFVRVRVETRTFDAFRVSLKDERIKISCDGVQKDARQFYPGDLALYVACFMIFGRLIERLEAIPTLYGWGRTYGDFASIGNLLEEHFKEHPGRVFVAADATRYDSTQSTGVRLSVYKLYLSLIDNLDGMMDLVGEVILALTRPEIHFDTGDIYEFDGLNPSGSFMTFTDNTVLTTALALGAGIEVFAAVGDDLIGVATPEAFRAFVSDAAANGLDFSKSETSDKLVGCEYLRNIFKHELIDGRLTWVPVPDTERLMGSLAYVHETMRVSPHQFADLVENMRVLTPFNPTLVKVLSDCREYLDNNLGPTAPHWKPLADLKRYYALKPGVYLFPWATRDSPP
jgi:hypothetical protein